MVQFSVSTDQLGYTAGGMSAALAQFDAQVSAINATVSGVVGGSWTGEAADAYLLAWQQWLANAELTRAALMAVSAKLDSAELGYESTEDGLVQRAKNTVVPQIAAQSGAATQVGTSK